MTGANEAAPLILCDDDGAQLLLDRARALAKPLAECEERARLEGYLRIRLGNDAHYGIPYRNTEEIIPVGTISRIPCTPPCVRGIINRRGEMLAVLDLNALFARNGTDDMDRARILVVNAAGLTVGLLVDEVLDNDVYDPEELDRPLPALGLPRTEHVLGLHAGTVAVLDLEALLGDGQFLGLAA
jgi:purine-binding chemotaxis protein CheW